MRKKRDWVIAVSMCLLVSILFYHQAEKSNFILDKTSNATPYGAWRRAACAVLNLGELWRIGNTSNALTKTVLDNLQVTVDNQPISPKDISTSDFLNLTVKTDPFGLNMFLGSYGGPIMVCFNVSEFTNGQHMVILSTQNTWHEEYSHTWSFKIIDIP